MSLIFVTVFKLNLILIIFRWGNHYCIFDIVLLFCLQIAASYGSTVCIFEPVQQQDQKDTSITVSRLYNPERKIKP